MPHSMDLKGMKTHYGRNKKGGYLFPQCSIKIK